MTQTLYAHINKRTKKKCLQIQFSKDTVPGFQMDL
jgi:hypothetical protein